MTELIKYFHNAEAKSRASLKRYKTMLRKHGKSTLYEALIRDETLWLSKLKEARRRAKKEMRELAIRLELL